MTTAEHTLTTRPVTVDEAQAHLEDRRCAEDHPTIIVDGPTGYLAVTCGFCESRDHVACQAD